ncbi:5597_t:CDS:2 [Entrophospora sp. SA101]|nr:5597_t:CDS:2 [Entrophospora sp. SA101]
MELSTATRCENCRELIEQKNNTIEFQQNKLINYQDLLVKAQRDLIDTKNELLRIKAKYSIGFRIYDNSDGEDGSSSFDYLAATATITTNSDKIFDNFPDYNSVSDESNSISYYKAVNSGKLSIGDVTVRIEEIRLS